MTARGAVREHPHVALVGAMGSGKTTIGRLAAAALSVPFVDNDDALQRATGSDAGSFSDQRGTAALHRAEAQVLIESLAGDRPSVVAAAASTIEDERCRRALARRSFTVWLTAPVADLADRAAKGSHRPLEADLLAQLRRLGRRRDRCYAAIADLTIDVSAVDAASAAALIASRVRAPAPDAEAGRCQDHGVLDHTHP